MGWCGTALYCTVPYIVVAAVVAVDRETKALPVQAAGYLRWAHSTHLFQVLLATFEIPSLAARNMSESHGPPRLDEVSSIQG